MHGRGVCMAGGHTCPPTHTHYKIRSVNARAVRILLECILVLGIFPQKLHEIKNWTGRTLGPSVRPHQPSMNLDTDLREVRSETL